MKIALHCPLGGVTGYGNDGIGLASALIRAGHDVHLSPTSVSPPIAPEVALLLAKFPEPPFDLAVLHADPGGLAALPGRSSVARRAVAWTMWEHDDPDPAWAERFTEVSQEFTALLAYDEVSERSLAPISKAPTRRLQGGYDPDPWTPVRRDWGGTFRFGMVGDLGPRKDPFAAIKAFAALKAEHGEDFDAELHLKTVRPGVFPPAMAEAYPWLHIHLGVWPQQRLDEFYASLHTLVAPSRGEGKNIPALEAMTTACPVIATAVGGHLEWLRDDLATRVPVVPGMWEGAPWPVADPEALQAAMWDAYTDRTSAREKGERAARAIPAQCSWDAVARRLLALTDSLPTREPTRGWT